MKNSIFACAFIYISLSVNAHAQVIVQTNAPDYAGSQALLNAYIQNAGKQGASGRITVDEILSKGLAPTSDNVKNIRALLSRKVSSDEKVALIRLLGSLHTHENKSGLNAVIAQDLSSLARTGQRDVARAAVLSYSRLGYYQDQREVLRYANEQGNINSDEYFGELAHSLRFAPEHDQLLYVNEIKQSKNKYAHEILAFVASNSALTAKFYPSTKKELLQALLESEPEFDRAIGQYSLIDGVRYSTWLHSVATLKSATSDDQYSDSIIGRLTSNEIDPRKIMAYLSSNEGKAFIANSKRKDALLLLAERAALFSKQLPQNLLMQDIVHDIQKTVNTMK